MLEFPYATPIPDGGEATDANTIVMELDLKCNKRKDAAPDAVANEDLYENSMGELAVIARDWLFLEAHFFLWQSMRSSNDDVDSLLGRLEVGSPRIASRARELSLLPLSRSPCAASL